MFMFGNKGVIFIFDLIFSLLIVVLIFISIFSIHPKENLNFKDLTFEGVKHLYGDLDSKPGDLCREYYNYDSENYFTKNKICVRNNNE